MTYIQDWITALQALGLAPKQRGQNPNKWESRCPHPAHPDNNPSFQFDAKPDGKVVGVCQSKNCYKDDYKLLFEHMGLARSGGPPPPIRRPSAKPPDASSPPDETEPRKPRPLPSGAPWHAPHTYHDVAGTPVLAVVRKDLGKNEKTGRMRKTFLQFTPAPDAPGLWIPGGIEEDRPLYHLTKIAGAGPVALVEGEKCVEACEKAWPDQITSTFAGGGNAWQRTDYEPLRGRKVALIADTDTPSRTAMRQLAYYLDTELDCTVQVALPEGETKADVADWLKQDTAATVLLRLKELLQNYEPDENDRTEPPADPKPPLEGDIVSNPHYRLLGLSGDQVAFWISAGRVLLQSRESLCQPNTLISLARLEFWYRLTAAESFSGLTARRIGDSLLALADELGQVDLTRVTGRGAFRLDDGVVGYHLGDRLLCKGEFHPLASDYSRNGASPRPKALNERYFIAEPRIELGDEASDKQMRNAAKALMAYRWPSEVAGRRILGWLVAATVGGALEWRPHLMFAAPSSTGKTWFLKDVIQLILGRHVIKTHDATPAAVSRWTANSGLALLVDEAEHTSDWVMDLFTLLRGAAGGDSARLRADRGSADGVVAQYLRVTALMSATAVPALVKADASRWVVVTLGDEVENWPAVQGGIKAAMLHADAIRNRIIQRAPEIVAAAAAKAEEYQALGMDSRQALMSAALTAGWAAWGVDAKDVYSWDDEDNTPPDAAACLRDILALEFRLDGSAMRTVHWVLANGSDEDQKQVTSRLGIRFGTFEDIEGLAIKSINPGLRDALSGTQWGRVDLRRKLLEIPGAIASKGGIRFPPSKAARAVLISTDALDAVDIGFDRDHP